MSSLLPKRPIQLSTIRARTPLHHCYETKYGSLATNPWSRARFALPSTHTNEPSAYPATWLGQTPEAALWETVLREVAPDAHHRVRVPHAAYAKYHLATLVPKEDIEVLVIHRPDILLNLDPKEHFDAEQAWEFARRAASHYPSHGVAAQAHREYFTAKARYLPGIGWKSHQLEDDTVYIFYQPPFDPSKWEEQDPFALDSLRGQQAIAQALARASMVLMAAPSGVGDFDDPEDDDP